MKKFTEYIVAAGIMLAFLLPAGVAFATIYSAGSLLQIGDVQSKHVLDGTLLNIDINGNAQISGLKIAPGGSGGQLLYSAGTQVATSTNLKYATSTGDLYILGGRIHATSTNFNGVNDTWPSSDGANAAVLTTNGAGTLSWAAVVASANPSFTATAGATLNVGNAVAIATSSGSTVHSLYNYTGALTGESYGVATPSAGQGTKMAQSFSFDGAQKFTGVAVQLRKYNAPADNAIIALQANTAGLPSGVDIQSWTISGASLGTSLATSTLYASTTITLATSTKYFLTFRRSGAGDDTNNYGAYTSLTTAATGTAYWLDSTSTWETTTLKGIYFEALASSTAGQLYPTDTGTTGLWEGFVGFANAYYGASANATITAGGVPALFSGLTAGGQYYLNGAGGAIGLTAGAPGRRVGVAFSSTGLVMQPGW